jgi:predicted dehydrogenase
MIFQRDYPRRLRVGVVGAGAHSYRVLLPLLNFLPVELVAIADPQGPLVETTARQYGVHAHTSAAAMYREERLDAVLIAVSAAFHPQLCVEALEAGLHVFCEKPIAFRAAEVDPIIAARGDRTVMVGYKKAFMPAIRRVRDILDREASGELLSVLGEYPMTVPVDGEAVLAERRFTPWLSNGCHPLSAMVAIGGGVEAVTTHLGPGGAGCVVLEYGNSAIGNLHLSDGMRGLHERYDVFARDAHLSIDNNLTVTWHRGGAPRSPGDFVPDDPDTTGSVSWTIDNAFARTQSRLEMTQGFHGELLHFCEQALAGQPVTDGTLEFARHISAIYEAALLSGGNRTATSYPLA